jgi:hypothetical protein
MGRTIDPGNPKDAKACIVFGLLVILIGGFPVLAALNIVPTDNSEFGAPRWLVAVIGGAFPAVGFFLIASGLRTSIRNPKISAFMTQMSAGFLLLTVLCLIGGGAIFLTMQLFHPTGGGSHLSIGPVSFLIPRVIGRYVDKVLIGFFAIILDAILLAILYSLFLSLFRALAGKKG